MHRIRQFALTEVIDFFVVSSFVHCRKPEAEIYHMALDMSQAHPAQVAFVDDQALYVEVAQRLGMHGISPYRIREYAVRAGRARAGSVGQRAGLLNESTESRDGPLNGAFS